MPGPESIVPMARVETTQLELKSKTVDQVAGGL